MAECMGLEQAARLLYKEWFVHLRFPGHEHAKIKDGVPEGWERKTAFDVMDTFYGVMIPGFQSIYTLKTTWTKRRKMCSAISSGYTPHCHRLSTKQSWHDGCKGGASPRLRGHLLDPKRKNRRSSSFVLNLTNRFII